MVLLYQTENNTSDKPLDLSMAKTCSRHSSNQLVSEDYMNSYDSDEERLVIDEDSEVKSKLSISRDQDDSAVNDAKCSNDSFCCNPFPDVGDLTVNSWNKGAANDDMETEIKSISASGEASMSRDSAAVEAFKQDLEHLDSAKKARTPYEGKENKNQYCLRDNLVIGRRWIEDSFKLSSNDVVALSSIMAAYRSYCQGKELTPLGSSALARLLHRKFPSVRTRRLGKRGNQRVHYMGLQLKCEGKKQSMKKTHNQKSDFRNLSSAAAHLKAHSNNVPMEQQKVDLDTCGKTDAAKKHSETTAFQQLSSGPEALEIVNMKKEVPQNLQMYPTKNFEENMKLDKTENLSRWELRSEKEVPIHEQAGGSHSFKPESSAKDGNPQSAALVARIASFLNLEGFASSECLGEANKLVHIILSITRINQLGRLLKIFSHSFSCKHASCGQPCMMFRRIRSHVNRGKHLCAVLNINNKIVNMHLDTCISDDCDMPQCSTLKVMRALHRRNSGVKQPQRIARVRPYGVGNDQRVVRAVAG